MPEEFILERFVFRAVLRTVLGLLLIAAVAYPVDWAIWRLRVASGGGMGAVDVNLFTVADLKGGKQDYYPQGTVTMPCSKSLYPQGGNGACWWVERHREVVQHY